MEASKSNLPKWQCHKIVGASRVVRILTRPPDPGMALEDGEDRVMRFTLQLECGDEIEKDLGFMLRHKVEIGGFYVEYEDGYSSFSPAATFISGYTLIAD